MIAKIWPIRSSGGLAAWIQIQNPITTRIAAATYSPAIVIPTSGLLPQSRGRRLFGSDLGYNQHAVAAAGQFRRSQAEPGFDSV